MTYRSLPGMAIILPKIRFMFNWTQWELADMLGVAPSRISQIETRTKPIKLVEYLAIQMVIYKHLDRLSAGDQQNLLRLVEDYEVF